MGFARNLATVPNSPAFSAVPSGTQSVSAATPTKLTFATEEFDTNSNYNNSTTFRFTPNVAGYYAVRIGAQTNGQTLLIAYIYKNGGAVRSEERAASTAAVTSVSAGALIYMNGTTDYLEAFLYSSGAATVTNSPQWNYFQAHLARAA